MVRIGQVLLVLLVLFPMWTRPACSCTGEVPFCACAARAVASASAAKPAKAPRSCCAKHASKNEQDSTKQRSPSPRRRCECDDCPSLRTPRDVPPSAPAVALPESALAALVESAPAPVAAPVEGVAPRALPRAHPPDLLSSVVLLI